VISTLSYLTASDASTDQIRLHTKEKTGGEDLTFTTRGKEGHVRL